MKMFLNVIHITFAVVAISVATHLTAQAVRSAIPLHGNIQSRTTTQPAATAPDVAAVEVSQLRAQVYIWQLAALAILTSALAFEFKRGAWRLASFVSWMSLLALTLRYCTSLWL